MLATARDELKYSGRAMPLAATSPRSVETRLTLPFSSR